MSDRDGDFSDFELPIGLDVVVGIIDAARAVEELEEEEINEEPQEPDTPEDSDPAGLAGVLRGLIDDLNEDEQATLIALTWIGRGDREPAEWEETLALARERNAQGPAADYLLGMEMLGDLLSELGRVTEAEAAGGYPAQPELAGGRESRPAGRSVQGHRPGPSRSRR